MNIDGWKYRNWISDELYSISALSLDMCCLENEAELRTDLAAPTLTITGLSPLMVIGLQNILTKCPDPAKSLDARSWYWKLHGLMNTRW